MELGVGDIVKGGVAGGIVATIGGLLLVVAKKMLGAPQDDINTGFTSLLGEMRQELRVACRQRDEFKALLETERSNTETLRGEIRQLRQITSSLEKLLRVNGVQLPPRRSYPQTHPELDVEIVDVTLRQDGIEDG